MGVRPNRRDGTTLLALIVTLAAIIPTAYGWFSTEFTHRASLSVRRLYTEPLVNFPILVVR